MTCAEACQKFDQYIRMKYFGFIDVFSTVFQGNPLCSSDDWNGYTVALLPHLNYLEIHPISAQFREKASARYQVFVIN